MSAGNFGSFSALDSPSNSPFAADSAVSAASALRRCSTVGAERERPQMLAHDWSADRNSIHANIMFPADYPSELLLLPHPPPPEIFAQARGEDSAAAAANQFPRNASAPAASAPAPSAPRRSASPPASVSASADVFGGGAASSFCRTAPCRNGAQTSAVYARDITLPPLAPPAAPVAPLLQRGNSGNQMETGSRFAGLKRPSDLTATVISPLRELGKPPAAGAAPAALHATCAALDTSTVAEAGNWSGSQGMEGRAGRIIPNCPSKGQSYCTSYGGGGVGADRDGLAGDNNGMVLAGGDKSGGEVEEMPALLEKADADLANLVNGFEEGGSKGVLVTDGTMVDVEHCEDVTKTGIFCGSVTGGEERAADGANNERMDDVGEPDELDTFDLTQMEGLDLPIVMSEANLDEISGISSADFLPDLPEDLFADLPLDAPFDVVTLCEDSSGCAAKEGLSDTANPSDARCEAITNVSASDVDPASVASAAPAAMFPASSQPPPSTPGTPPLIRASSPSTFPSPLLKLPPFLPPQPLLRAAPSSGGGRGRDRGEAVGEGGAVMGERGEAATAAPAAALAAAPAALAAAPAAPAAAAAAPAAAAAAAGLIGGKRGAAGVNQQVAAAVALNRLLQQRQMLSNPANNPKQQLLLRALTAAATTDSGVPPAALVSVIAASAAASSAASAAASSAGSEAGLGAGSAAGEASCVGVTGVPQVSSLPQGSPGRSGMEINTAVLASLLASASSSPSFATAAAASPSPAAAGASGDAVSVARALQQRGAVLLLQQLLTPCQAGACDASDFVINTVFQT
ncbi:unnamed protein product [Closterium sp. NIES-65]|nr:unnamed protein product [Closterium sp. NIES-65]